MFDKDLPFQTSMNVFFREYWYFGSKLKLFELKILLKISRTEFIRLRTRICKNEIRKYRKLMMMLKTLICNNKFKKCKKKTPTNNLECQLILKVHIVQL